LEGSRFDCRKAFTLRLGAAPVYPPCTSLGRIQCFWNVGEEQETTTQDGTKENSRPFLLRYYCVFNFSQTEGIDIPASLLQEARSNDPIETCEQIVTNMPNPPAFEQSDIAWYSPSNDVVGMPARGLFHSSEEYYATAVHEMAHSTGHAKRLHRENFDNPVSFGSESYSKGELTAEMTAAMLCGIAGIEQKTLENSAAYLKTWIARLKSDSRLLVSAASQAQKAADFIQGKLACQEGEWQPVGADVIFKSKPICEEMIDKVRA